MKVFVLNTGGTIGMVGHPLRPALTAAELYKGLKVPGDTQLELKEFYRLQDSTNIPHSDRIQMCQEIASVYQDYDAFVVLHGTDSLAETTAVFCMVFKQTLQKPVLVIGSQMSREEPGTDAVMQLENSLRLAASFVRKGVVGVYTVCVGDVFDGSRLKKQRESDPNYVDSPGRPPVAHVWPRIMHLDGLKHRDAALAIQGLRLDTIYERRVWSLSEARRDTNPIGLRIIVDSGEYKGIIIQCKGAGQLSDQPWEDAEGKQTCSWIEAVKYATDRGVYCAILSPFQDGRVILTRYELGQKLKDAGALSLESLTPDMADFKFRQALGIFPDDPARIQEFLSANLVNELLPGLEDER
ncbi:MAG: asparaginase domain-containing protein [bacterium]|nr:asparaginase domain-containing protein [bacterium]